MAIRTGLYGNFSLSNAEIDTRVGASLGTYVLGDAVDSEGGLTIRYVGRADDDLNKRLKDWVGFYKFFQYGHFSDKTANFEKESHLYHAFGGTDGKLDNKIHPAKAYTSDSCPVCGA
jgi:hypothetical protein